jgi:hypothetical protein
MDDRKNETSPNTPKFAPVRIEKPKLDCDATTGPREDVVDPVASAMSIARAQAMELLKSLPAQVIQQLEAIVKRYGQSRKGRRAVDAIMRRALRAKAAGEERNERRAFARADRNFVQCEQYARRMRKGRGPVKGMAPDHVAFLKELAELMGFSPKADSHP